MYIYIYDIYTYAYPAAAQRVDNLASRAPQRVQLQPPHHPCARFPLHACEERESRIRVYVHMSHIGHL